MSVIRHCGRSRDTVSYWLKPNEQEQAEFKHIVLLASNCPLCKEFVLEWYGVKRIDGLHSSQQRIRLTLHDEWIERTSSDIDEQMDIGQWRIKPGQSRTKCGMVMSSRAQFPWTPRMAVVK